MYASHASQASGQLDSTCNIMVQGFSKWFMIRLRLVCRWSQLQTMRLIVGTARNTSRIYLSCFVVSSSGLHLCSPSFGDHYPFSHSSVRSSLNPPTYRPASGTADAELKVPFAENSEKLKVLSLKPGVGEDIALHALHTAMNAVLLVFAFSIHSTSFPPKFSAHVKWRMWCTWNRIFTYDWMTCVLPWDGVRGWLDVKYRKSNPPDFFRQPIYIHVTSHSQISWAIPVSIYLSVHTYALNSSPISSSWEGPVRLTNRWNQRTS